MSINLGSVSFDENILFRQLRFDLKDDWFPDPIAFRDTFRDSEEQGLLAGQIVQNFVRNHGQYTASRRHILNIPKPNFTLRYGLEVSIADRAVYHGLCSFLSRHYDGLIPWYIFSHRRDAHRDDDRYMFRRGTIAWRDFIGAVDRSVADDKILLTTDLTNYFENIDLRKLRTVMQNRLADISASADIKNSIRAYISTLYECLEEWSYEAGRGLPQNRDASSFLANLYMLSIDERMRGLGYTYFRYMDDIKVVCDTRYQARRALKELSIALRDLGLAVNSKKTKIIDGSDRAAVAEALDGGSPEVEHLDSIWATRRRESISRSFPMLRQFTQMLLDEGRVDSREFRYCINRLIVLASCVEFSVPPAYFAAITDRIVELIAEHPAACDQFCRYLRVVPLSGSNIDAIAAHLRDSSRNFYTWQSYRIWMLLGQREVRRPELIAEALTIISAGDDNAARAGASIYLGAMGGTAERVAVAESFSTLSSFLGQRCALVAVQELPFTPHIRDNVASHVRDDLRGVYRNLRTTAPEYFSPIEEISITNYIDAERDYA